MFKSEGIAVCSETIHQPERGDFVIETINNCDLYFNVELKHLHLSHGKSKAINDGRYAKTFMEGA
jgi:hypothetical protein